ncbi:MAG: hypothetical protein K1X78_13595 [Verrucomicrobiaceae bacterium]|nr:hypothetical protein [Verrucomicrobiaceae bacterium]
MAYRTRWCVPELTWLRGELEGHSRVNSMLALCLADLGAVVAQQIIA